MSRGLRVWDIASECYLPPSRGSNDGALGVTIDGADIIYLEDGEVNVQSVKDAGVIIEQPTGLKDKNGKEIYEGDIVGTYEYYYNKETGEDEPGELEPWGVIVYEAPSFGLWGEAIYGGEDRHFYEVISGMVVMGNIHENPELLGDDDE